MKKQDYDYEILVVNDGSTDRTADLAASLQKRIEYLEIIDNKENHGKGYVVRQGMRKAKGDFRLFMDADNSTTVDHVEKMWPHFFEGGYDLVIGSRDLPDSIIPVSQSCLRRRLGDMFNLIVQVFSGLWGIWDTQAGFKGFSAKAAEDVFSRAVVNRWAFDVEALVIAKKLGYRIKEVPLTWVNDPHSKVKLTGMVRMFFEVLQVRFNSIRGKYGKA